MTEALPRAPLSSLGRDDNALRIQVGYSSPKASPVYSVGRVS